MHRPTKPERMTICAASQAVGKKQINNNKKNVRNRIFRFLATKRHNLILALLLKKKEKILTPTTARSILTHFVGGGQQPLKSLGAVGGLGGRGDNLKNSYFACIMRRVFFLRGAGLSGSPWVGFPGQTDSSTLASLSSHRDILRHVFILQIIPSWGGTDRRLRADDTLNK